MTDKKPRLKDQLMKLPKGYRVYPEGNNGARFETPTTFGWAASAEIALAEIELEIRTGDPAYFPARQKKL